MERLRLRPRDRLKKRADFRRVQSEGRAHTASFVVLVHPAPTGTAGRIGVTVTKKIGGAVQRNRIKRLVREVFRQNRACFPERCDVVLIAKRNLDTLDYRTLENEIRRARHAVERACAKARQGR